ncbi:MAG: EamA family transporter [Lachnospiraceae bacterium]|nr:EamA family transporter [Lachnospiraceae bacterium]
MNSFLSISIYTASGFIAAISQLLLKFAALKPNGRTGILKYLDIRIISSYAMLFGTVFMNMIAMRFMPYKFAPVLSTLSYVFVLILGKLVLHEEIGKKRASGILVIFLGMIVFYLGQNY